MSALVPGNLFCVFDLILRVLDFRTRSRSIEQVIAAVLTVRLPFLSKNIDADVGFVFVLRVSRIAQSQINQTTMSPNFICTIIVGT